MELRDALRMLRSETGLTQSELAAAVNVGYCAENRWENQNTRPNRASSMAILAFAESRGASSACLDALSRILLASRADDRTEKQLVHRVTEQMKLEQRLLLTSDQMKAMIDNLDIAIIGQRFLSGRPESCKIFYQNEFYRELLGYSSEEFCERTAEDTLFAMTPDSRRDFLEQLGSLLSHRLAVADFKCIVKQVRKDGTEVWVEVKACSLSEYSFGQELFTYCRDVTQRVEAEHRYAEEVAIRDASLSSMFASIHVDLIDNAVLRHRNLSAVNGGGYSGESASQILGQLVNKVPRGEGYSDFQQKFNRNALLAAFEAGDILGSVKAFNTAARRWLRCEYVLVRNRYNEHIELLVYFYDIQSQVLTEKMMGMISEKFFDYIGLIDVEEKTIKTYFISSGSDGQAAAEKRDYASVCEEKLKLLLPPYEVPAVQETLSLDNVCGQLKKSPYFSVGLPADVLDESLRPKRIVFAFLDEIKKSIIVAQENIGPVLTERAGRR